MLAELRGLGLPVFVKPVALGSSVGIGKATTEDELAEALDSALAHDARAIVEAAAEGLEVECSVIGDREPLASVPGEITISADWYDYEAKYTPGGMELVVPARIPDDVRERVRELAVATFRLTGCSGLAGWTSSWTATRSWSTSSTRSRASPRRASSATLFEASGIPYAELLDRLVGFALERHERERSYRH